MPEGEGQGSAQEQGSEQPGEGQQGSEGSAGERWDEERARRTIDAQRASEKALKDELSSVKGELKKLQDAQLSDAERKDARIKELEGEVTSLQGQLGTVSADTALLAEAVKAGASKPEAVVKLVDRSTLEVEGGKLKGAAKAVETVKKDYPELFGKVAGGDGGPRGGAPTADSMNDRLRRAAGR